MKRIEGFTKPTICFSFKGIPWLVAKDPPAQGDDSNGGEETDQD